MLQTFDEWFPIAVGSRLAQTEEVRNEYQQKYDQLCEEETARLEKEAEEAAKIEDKAAEMPADSTVMVQSKEEPSEPVSDPIEEG